MRFIKLAIAGRAPYMRYISVLLMVLVNPFIIPLLSYVSDLPVHLHIHLLRLSVAQECSKIPCGRFGYCYNGSCQCEVGFIKRGNRCTGKCIVMYVNMALAKTENYWTEK